MYDYYDIEDDDEEVAEDFDTLYSELNPDLYDKNSILKEIDSDILTDKLIICLNQLREDEKFIIQHRFIDSDMTLAELGEELDLTRERIRQIESKSLSKLKKLFMKNIVENENVFEEY
jgi:RNA polymerase sigma factor (sigma-70 family)